MRKLLFVVFLVLLAVVARLCLFTVDAAEYVYLTQFGRHIATYDGADASEAGLHFKWPWPIQSVQRVDRRLQYLDLPGAELPTSDETGTTPDQMLTIDAYVCWRIADRSGVDQLIRSVGTIEGAQAILDKDINNELGAAIGQMKLSELISTQSGEVESHRNSLPQQILDRPSVALGGQTLREHARSRYGIEVVDIRLRRTSYPAAVRPAIFDRIISERERKASEYESEGERLASEIRSDTDLQVSRIKTDAEATAIAERGRGDAAADSILADAALRRPEFYTLLKEIEDLRRALGTGKTLLLLSTRRFKVFNDAASSSQGGQRPSAVGGAATSLPSTP